MIISELYKVFIKHPFISTDSRSIKKGYLFWALKGENFNGNNFIKKAIEKGASFVITDDNNYKSNNKCIYVDDSLLALQQLAKYHRIKLGLPIIAITGTNGKTTTKELIHIVLKKKYKVKATKGNYNNHIGVPLTLLSFNNETEIGIVEMGANHQNEIEFLCNIAIPDYGIITNIGKAHLEGFGTFEVLIKTKAELYEAINKKNAKLFINNDNELLKKLIKDQEVITYGTSENDFCFGKIISAEPFLKFSIGANLTLIKTNLIGKYNFENLLAAACVGKYFKINNEKIKQAIEEYVPNNNRSQIIKKGNLNIILDAYNANPTSMGMAIDNFINIKSQKKVLILGDMFELGDKSDIEHLKILETLTSLEKNNNNIQIFIAGLIFNKLNTNKNIHSYKTTEELIKSISQIQFHDTWFLIKGSRGMKLENVVENIYFS